MDQLVIFKLVINKENRDYEFNIKPGYSWDEIQEVLSEFKVEVENLKQAAIKAENEKEAIKPEPVQS